ncbi:uncharacterized protein [Diadema antillarum]|uniref:uncharacterized protein n=1 Tax=Diadema antillarum TaxID=105358 RepID=UPI003A88B7A1
MAVGLETVLALAFLWNHGAAVNLCNDLTDYVTTIVSPEHPAVYPAETQREWEVEIQQGMQVKVDIDVIAIERTWDTLTVTHVAADEHSSNATVIPLVTGNVTSLILSEGTMNVRFCSDEFVELTGFAFHIRARDLNDSLSSDCFEPAAHEFRCLSGLQFIQLIAKCDGIVDCHDHSDEIGCNADCPSDAYLCQGTDHICLHGSFQCDGWLDCPLHDDEADCHLKCPDGCICGEGPYAHFFGPRRALCGDPDWLPYWTNGTNAWSGEYARNSSKKTVIVDLHDIPLYHLDPRSFFGVNNLNTLDLSGCELTYLPPGVFDGVPRLYKLYIRHNRLTFLEKGTFRGLFHLNLMFMEYNEIHRFDEGCFQDLNSVFFVDLEYNNITEFRPGTFRDLGNSLERLIITRNNLTSINASLFYGLENTLLRVNMYHNELRYIAPGTFENMSRLTDLLITSLTNEPWLVYPGIFDGLDSLTAMHAYDPRLCCLAPPQAECILDKPSHPLFTCRKTFLHNETVKIFIWILGISALIGNALVITMRMRSKPSTTVAKVQASLIINLALSDFLMGVYMVLLAIMDIYIGESYFWEGRSEEWRSSAVCQLTGFISMVSSEASVFLLTLISMDRFVCIIFPFSQKRLDENSVKVAISLVWIAAIFLSVVAVLLNNVFPDAYSLSDVCVGLPFMRKSSDFRDELDERVSTQYQTISYFTAANSSISTWQFSIVLFLGINLASFLIILISYMAIFVKVRFARAEVGRKEQASKEFRMALRMFLIVGTDFFCWMPIIILGILVQTFGIEVTPEIYAWLVVFVLPINSALNPYLYTIIHMAGSQ